MEVNFGVAREHEQSCAAGAVKGGGKPPFCLQVWLFIGICVARGGLAILWQRRGMKDARTSVKGRVQIVGERESKTMHERKA